MLIKNFKGGGEFPNHKGQYRITADLEKELYLEFKKVAGIRGHFQKGYTRKALIEAIEIYIWMVVSLYKYHKELGYVSNKEFNHIEDPRERHKATLEQAIWEYIDSRLKKED